jgi:ATP-dependent Clp protease adaptor protein ClpS
MLNIHRQGLGIAGVYHKEIAETKVAIVHDLAQKNEYPLRGSIEKV